MMKFKITKNKETKTINEVIINGINFGVSDNELKTFLKDVIEHRPDILIEEEILDKLDDILPKEDTEEIFDEDDDF